MLSGKKQVVIGVLSCAFAGQRRSWCRDLWVNRARDYAVLDVFFAIGCPDVTVPVRVDDVLLLPCDDSYACLPQKTRGMLRYALSAHAFDHFFKCDDDTYVDVDRLLEASPALPAFTGWPIGRVGHRYAHGGSGYMLNYAAAQAALQGIEKVDRGDEDRAVGQALETAGIRLHEDRRFVPEFNAAKIPNVSNRNITLHRVRTAEQYQSIKSGLSFCREQVPYVEHVEPVETQV